MFLFCFCLSRNKFVAFQRDAILLFIITELFKQTGKRDIEGGCNLFHAFKSSVLFSSFQLSDVGALVNLSPTHVSVIERGLKVTKLDTFIAIANALDVSADTLLIDVVTHSVSGVTNELSEMIEKLPKEKQQRIINAVRALVE